MLAEADCQAHAANAGIMVFQTDLKDILQQLGKGANSGHNENTHRLKILVVHWLMEGTPKPDPPLSISDKSGRGFYNDMTGKLLCLVDYNWNNLSFDYLHDFNSEDPAKGLFKGIWLVRLHFALSSCESWALVDSMFNCHDFYNSIVDWFKETLAEDELSKINPKFKRFQPELSVFNSSAKWFQPSGLGTICHSSLGTTQFRTPFRNSHAPSESGSTGTLERPFFRFISITFQAAAEIWATLPFC
ncbi:hypothetical protein HD554DRAFT_2035474 [Boletus coccyginus]|nr:hypothetical protein HD554DRAFT_2035474 [Boletus coccyginus]